MRICHVIDYFHTDVGYQEYFLAREMARAGHAVRVVSSPFRQHTVAVAGPDEEAGAAELVEAGVEVVRLPGRQLGHDRAWLRGLVAAVIEHRPDVVHVHGPFCPTTVRTVRACSRRGIPVLVDNHIQDAIAPGAGTTLGRLTYTAFRLAFGPGLRRRVAAWVANGPYEAAFLEHRLGLPEGAVQLVPLAFDPKVFGFDPAQRHAVRAERGWSEDALVVAVTGKLHAGKRVDAVAAAAEEVGRQGRVHLVLAGSIGADDLASVHAAAPKLAAAGQVSVLGMLGRDDLADVYRAADVVVFARLPSISIYEAAGTGVRLLVGRDAFSSWLHGLLPAIEPVDLPIEPELLRAADDRSARAREAERVLSWEAVTDQFLDRYRTLVAGRGPSR